jgi:hypothetical protein
MLFVRIRAVSSSRRRVSFAFGSTQDRSRRFVDREPRFQIAVSPFMKPFETLGNIHTLSQVQSKLRRAIANKAEIGGFVLT